MFWAAGLLISVTRLDDFEKKKCKNPKPVARLFSLHTDPETKMSMWRLMEERIRRKEATIR